VGYSDAYPGGYGAGGSLITSLFIETDPDDWYDATEDLISGSTNRGKQNELDRYQAGTMTVVLDNDDRTYDPTYAASPLDGYVLPMKRVKLTATWDGETYPLFFGYADRWTQNREGPHRGTTTLSATDGFKVLERALLPSSSYAVDVEADTPTHWWRLGEAPGATVAEDSSRISWYQGTYVGGVTLGEDGAMVNDMDTAASFDGVDDYVTFGLGPLVAGNTYTIEMWLRIPERTTTGWMTFFSQNRNVDSTGEPWGIVTGTDLGDPGKVQWGGQESTSRIDDDAWHHVALVNSAGTATLYIDGVAEDTGAGVNGTGNEVLLGYPANAAFVAISRKYWPGRIDEVATWATTALSAGQIESHNDAGRVPWDGDLPGPRIERVLDAIDWPDDLRDIDTGNTTLQSAELDMSALEHVQKVSDTEFGDLFMSADGLVVFEDRDAAANQPVAATFSDAPGGDLPITFSNPELSDEHIRNDVTVSRLQGTAINVRDGISIGTYQQMSYVRDGLYHDDDAHSRYLAEFILAGYKNPVERVSNMTVNPYADPDNLWPVVLGLELTDRVVLNETPQNVAPEVSRTVVVEGIGHTFGPKSWVASFNLSENTVATQPYWQLGVAGYSELGETTRLYL
jgi:hypothetical protein